jgi:hypothetical protein
MGTRADFYVGRGEKAEWIGSIAYDGDPKGIPKPLLKVTSEADFRRGVYHFLLSRDDKTLPEQGWPWPWETSSTTDYAYAFDESIVHASNYGGAWFDPLQRKKPHGRRAVFPAMSKGKQREKLGPHSGVTMLVAPREDE